MIPESKPFELETPLGKLYVSVIDASEYHYYRTGHGKVTELRPRVRVGTDPAFETDHTSGAQHWTIRRRAYTVHRTFYFNDLSHIEYSNGANGDRWHKESAPHQGGYRNDRGGQVEFDTATYNQINDAVITALDKFAEGNPQWADMSVLLLLRIKRNRELSKAAQAHKEAEAAEAEASKLAADMDPIFQRMPRDLFGHLTS